MRNKHKPHSVFWYTVIGFAAFTILCATLCICTMLLYLTSKNSSLPIAPPIPAPELSSYDSSAHINITKPSDENALSNEEIYKKTAPSVVDINAYDYNSIDTLSCGTGIIISQNGLILTNAHVIENSLVCEVVLYDGKKHLANIVGSDAKTDLAVLQISADDLTAAEFGDSDALRIGEQVFAMGNPLAEFTHSFTQGIVSGLNRSFVVANEYGEYGAAMNGLIQTDASVNSGNSGGPLINSHGQVIGINTLDMSTESGADGIAFAIALNTAKPIIDGLIDLGYIPRASLGITLVEYVLPSNISARLPIEGVYIESISQNSALVGTDINEGDILIAIDGENVIYVDDAVKIIDKHKSGDKIKLLICHAQTGEITEHTVSLIDLEQ
ncbi:MAG: trypsin-like peptidase domain-containing protein [Oscillospiraceae bacterium]